MDQRSRFWKGPEQWGHTMIVSIIGNNDPRTEEVSLSASYGCNGYPSS
jgi:hypothetical protein